MKQECGLDMQPGFKVNYKVRIIYQKGPFNHPLKALNILFNLQEKKNKWIRQRGKKKLCIGLEKAVNRIAWYWLKSDFNSSNWTQNPQN